MKTLHVMVGLPRSGKSTKAKEFGYPIVEPDALHRAIHGTPWYPDAEPLVWSIAQIMVIALFETGHDDIVLDATNHTKKRRAIWENIKWVNKYCVIDTPKEVCIKRAIESDQEYLLPIIGRMAAQFENLDNAVDS